ncbi:MAG TPA: MBL fold metallo-hydrolase [Chitinophagales bacterium]|nr:MBL fold metallo-hydrolase [Chitinophagales bacterium]
MAEIKFANNPELKTILKGWKGNPVAKGRFIDPKKRFTGGFMKAVRWKLGGNDKAEEKKNDKWRLKVQKGNAFLKQKGDCIVWLGHASFFLQLKGKRILIDPVFGRISGIVPRYSELPCAAEDFMNIDYVLLSHAHRDHCDKSSLQKVFAQNPNATLLTSLNTGKLVAGWVSGLKFQEAGWYQQYNLPDSKLRITFLPTQHWSNRFMTDINQTLYGSFMIEADGLNIFFNGDSGYCSYPKQIGEMFPNIDIAMIGVGAYHPAFMMKDVHTNPHEAVHIFHDLKAKTFIPMHYGTFDLADEPLGEPYRTLKQLEAEKKINGDLKLLDVGEVFALS